MDWRVAVLLLLLFLDQVSAAELRLDGGLHNDSVDVTLQNNADHEVFFNLKFQLKQKADTWALLEELPCSVNGSIAPLKTRDYKCAYTSPKEPGQYKIFVRADIVNSTYTYKDFLLGAEKDGSDGAVPQGGVLVRMVSAPRNVTTGQEFVVSVNVTSDEKTALEIYSYVYNGSACYSFYGWKGNAQTVEFEAGETKTVNLSNLVKHETPTGVHKFKVRARGEKDYDITRDLAVKQTAPNLQKSLPDQSQDHETDDKSGISTLFLVISAIPLLALCLIKVLSKAKKR